MRVIEDFPSDLSTHKVNKDFIKVVGQIIGNKELVYSPTDELPISVLTARTLSIASSELQNWVNIPVSNIFEIRCTPEISRVSLCLPVWDFEASKSSYALCAYLWNKLSKNDFDGDIKSLAALWNRELSIFKSKSINEYSQVKSIMKLGFNFVRRPNGVLCVGTGSRSRWLDSTTTDQTSGISIKNARDKYQTAMILRGAGLPGGVNKLVSSEDEAVLAARAFGGSVVIKPADQDRGDGVTANLTMDIKIKEAFKKARAFSTRVLVEKMIPGFTHRLTVVDGTVISVRQRIPGGITGDGISTISDLVLAKNATDWGIRWKRTRGTDHISLDGEALDILEEVNLSPNSILEKGCFQRLRRRDNINAGGTNNELVLDGKNVHPDNIDLAINATKEMRLDIAGIDLITIDISKSWREVNAAICEINARPQFVTGKDSDLFEKLIVNITGINPHVRCDLIICSDDRDTRASLVNFLSRKKNNLTISSKEGIYRKSRICTEPFGNGFHAALAAITSVETNAAVCIMSIKDLLGYGSPVRKWTRIIVHRSGLKDNEESLLPVLNDFLNVRGSVAQID